MVMASARKKVPVTPVTEMSGRKEDDDWRDGRKYQRLS